MCVGTVKPDKTVNASQVITFMGLGIDSTLMTARLPTDKLSKLRLLLPQFTRRKKVKLRELQSLLGLLKFFCNVVLPGRCFLRRLTDLTRGGSRPHHHISLTREGRRDFLAWQVFVDHFNGKHLLFDHRWISDEALHLYTDASGAVGYGAVFGAHWFFGKWPQNIASRQITFKELLPIVLALEIWGSQLRNRCIILHFDNEAVLYILNKQTSKDSHVMVLVRRLVIACMKHNILVRSAHIHGKDNVLPDLLSRLQIYKFRATAVSMDQLPTAVPEEI